MELFKLGRQDHAKALIMLQGMGLVDTIYLTDNVKLIKSQLIDSDKIISYNDTIDSDEFRIAIQPYVDGRINILVPIDEHNKYRDIALKYVVTVLKNITVFEDAIESCFNGNQNPLSQFLETNSLTIIDNMQKHGFK